MPRRLKEMPLFPSEAEIAFELLGDANLVRWRPLARDLERRGMPQIDPVFGRRYWPAVKAWLDRRAGLTTMMVPSKVDGKERPIA